MTANADPMPANLTANLTADLWLIRHAPSLDGGAMAGRRDVAADCSETAQLAGLRAKLAQAKTAFVWASPAQRCLQTAAALGLPAPQTDARLWEQDFGEWEGRAYADLPDLGPLTAEKLARFSPPSGESFVDLAARCAPVLAQFGAGQHLVIAHAGIIRAALGLALGAAHLGLGFAIAPLSLTCLCRDLASGQWAISCVNWTAP